MEKAKMPAKIFNPLVSMTNGFEEKKGRPAEACQPFLGQIKAFTLESYVCFDNETVKFAFVVLSSVREIYIFLANIFCFQQ